MSGRHPWTGLVAGLLLLSAGAACNEPRYQGRTVSSWTHDLGARDDYKRRRACEALAALGPRASSAATKLAERLDDVNEGVQEFAQQALASIGPAAVPPLEERLASRQADSSPEARLLASIALIEIDPHHRAASQALVAALTGVGNAVLSKRAGEAIVRAGRPMVHALLPALADPYLPVRVEVARTLGRIGPDAGLDAVEGLSRAARDRAWEVRQVALRALARVGSQEAVEGLIRAALDDDREEVAQTAAMMMRYIGKREGVSGNEIFTDEELEAAAQAEAERSLQ